MLRCPVPGRFVMPLETVTHDVVLLVVNREMVSPIHRFHNFFESEMQ